MRQFEFMSSARSSRFLPVPRRFDVPEEDLQRALVLVQRPSQRALAELVQLLHGAQVLRLLLATRVSRGDKLRQRLDEINFGRLF